MKSLFAEGQLLNLINIYQTNGPDDIVKTVYNRTTFKDSHKNVYLYYLKMTLF